MKEGYWVIRTYKAGRIGEKIKYWVPGQKPTRSQRRIKADIRKQQQNENDATKRVARIINENYQSGDAFDALTYSDENYIRLLEGIPEGLDEEARRDYIYRQAEHELDLFLRRCRYACKKVGVELKYFAITSDMDGETGEPARIHHHILVSKAVKKIIRPIWQNGIIEKNSIWEEEDHFGLAKYLMDQVRRIPDAKKYKRSRNMVIPEPKDRVALGGKEVQPPRGAEIIYRGTFLPGRPQYIRYILPKENVPCGGVDPGNETGGGKTVDNENRLC